MSTPVVKKPIGMLVDRGTRPVHYLRVSTLKDRIREILDEGFFSSERGWSKAAGLPPVTVNKLLKRSGADEGRVELRTIELLAEAVGVPASWLAYGVGGLDDDPPIASLLLKLRRIPGLEAVVEKHPGRWRTSTVWKASRETHQSDSDGIPIGGWEKVLDSIESGRAGRTSGDAAAVTTATRRQAGRRPKLPRKSA